MGPAEAARAGWALAGLLRSQWRLPGQLRARQLGALRAQLRHATARVPYYRRRAWAARLGTASWPQRLEDLAELPTVRRAHIQADPEAFLADEMDRRSWHSCKTSGSTGRPLVSWFDPACWGQVKVALKVRRLFAQGWRPGQRVVIIEALDPTQANAHGRAQALPGESWLGARRYLSVFEPPQQHREAYLQARPHYIYGFPSYFLALADIWDEELRARIPLQALMTSAEWIHPEARQRLQAAFGVPVLDVYGSTECKEIAWQCPRSEGYHVNMESVVVEVLDDGGRPLPAGEVGEVVVTTLTNRAMPLIRYATGDRARRLEGSCPCGRGLERLAAIEGRVADDLEVPGLGRVSPYELTTMIEAQPGVVQYRVRYRPPDALEVQLVLAPSANGETLSALQQALASRLQGRVRVSVDPVAVLPRAASGKARCVEVVA